MSLCYDIYIEIMIIIGFIGLSVLHSVEMSTYVNMSLQSIGTCSVCWGLKHIDAVC